MADDKELIVAEQLYTIWRNAGATPVGKAWGKLSTSGQHRWVAVAHAVVKVTHA